MGGFQPLFPSSAPPSSEAEPSGFEPIFSAKSTRGFTSMFAAQAPAAEPPAPPADIETLLAEARAEGAEAARAELQQERQALEEMAAALAPALDEVARARQEAITQAAGQIGEIVLCLAQRVIADSLALHPDALTTVVAQAVSILPDDDELSVRVRPEDVERVRSTLPERFAESVVGDSTVEAGCRVVARHASIDATLKAAVSGAEAAVQTWLDSRS